MRPYSIIKSCRHDNEFSHIKYRGSRGVVVSALRKRFLVWEIEIYLAKQKVVIDNIQRNISTYCCKQEYIYFIIISLQLIRCC